MTGFTVLVYAQGLLTAYQLTSRADSTCSKFHGRSTPVDVDGLWPTSIPAPVGGTALFDPGAEAEERESEPERLEGPPSEESSGKSICFFSTLSPLISYRHYKPCEEINFNGNDYEISAK